MKLQKIMTDMYTNNNDIKYPNYNIKSEKQDLLVFKHLLIKNFGRKIILKNMKKKRILSNFLNSINLKKIVFEFGCG